VGGLQLLGNNAATTQEQAAGQALHLRKAQACGGCGGSLCGGYAIGNIVQASGQALLLRKAQDAGGCGGALSTGETEEQKRYKLYVL